jgi:putative Ca2+/H+ antiporter (TMEM165/GDT1 family)
MDEAARAALVAFGVIFVAELGDKTQLLALGFGARYSLRQVALGLTLGYGSAGLVAVIVGGALGAAFPERPIELVGGIVFVIFAILAVRPDDDGDDRVSSIAVTSVIASIALTILVAEMGDKTQIATATLAARANPIGTWVGATLGEVASGMVGAVAGNLVGDRVSPRVLRLTSAALFATFGVVMIAGWT